MARANLSHVALRDGPVTRTCLPIVAMVSSLPTGMLSVICSHFALQPLPHSISNWLFVATLRIGTLQPFSPSVTPTATAPLVSCLACCTPGSQPCSPHVWLHWPLARNTIIGAGAEGMGMAAGAGHGIGLPA